MFINYGSSITVTDVFSAVRLLNSPVGTTTVRSKRNQWAIALKTEGKTVYSAKNFQIISDKHHPVILPKGSTYSWSCIEPGECIIVEFDASEEYENLLSFEYTDENIIPKYFSKIEKLMNLTDSVSKMESIALVYEMLISLMKSSEKSYLPKDKKLILTPAIDYISQNYYNSDITNDFLSALCCVSTVYFRKLFYNVYGVSPVKYLNSLRISKAKAILVSDFDSINQIAQSVGYTSIYHFSKMFKAYTGMSPTEYKKSVSG